MNKFLKTLLLSLCLITGSGAFAQGTAYLQIIHNCPDPALDTVDIYFNGLMYDTNMAFRTVHGFYPILSDSAVTITVAHKHSAGVTDSIRSFYYSSFASNTSYILMLTGLTGTGFVPNPDGRNTGFDMKEISQIDSVSPDTAAFDFKFFQGATDLPAIKIVQRVSGQQVVPGVLYADTTTYTQLHHNGYELQILSADSTQNFGTYRADFSNLAGRVGLIFTSGFANPLQNDTGALLGLYAALGDGTLIPLTPETSAFQLIHNCADTAADSVDVYVNGQLYYPGFAFRNATPALALYAHAPYQIALAHKNSTSAAGAFWDSLLVLQPDTFYIATLSGLINPGSYAPNKGGENTAFNVWLKAPAEYTPSSNINFDFFLIQGATDAPALQLTPEGGPPVVTAAGYGTQTGYLSFPSHFYTFDLQDTLGGLLGSYFANFPAYAGQSGVLLVSGFLNPAANNNGAGLGLYMVPVTGGPFVPLYVTTGIKNIAGDNDISVFPNPVARRLFIHINMPGVKHASLAITSLSGQMVSTLLDNDEITSPQTITADVSNLSAGLYILKITTVGGVSNYKFVVAR